MIQVKIGGVSYPATVSGTLRDTAWDGRESKSVTLAMTHDAALAAFCDGAVWSIVVSETQPTLDADGVPTGETETVSTEYDNSDYSLAGDVTDHRDGSVTVKLGKPTDLENAYEALYGGEGA